MALEVDERWGDLDTLGVVLYGNVIVVDEIFSKVVVCLAFEIRVQTLLAVVLFVEVELDIEVLAVTEAAAGLIVAERLDGDVFLLPEGWPC